MKTLLTVILVMVGAIATTMVFRFAKDYGERERTDREHSEKEETEVIITNLAGATLELSRAGTTMGQAVFLCGDTAGLWLPTGNYFLTARLPGKSWFLPVPITGFRSGPSENGTLIVTIRQPPRELPPRLKALGPHFVFIPAGFSLIGDRLNPRERHYVWLTGYFIYPFEVTNSQFREFTDDADGYANDTNWTSAGRRWKRENRSNATALLKPHDHDYARFGLPDQPTVWLTWYEANAFCRWLTRTRGAHRWLYSLPTDAEWEKAARGPDNFDYGLGTTISDSEVQLYNWRKNPDAPVTVIGIEESYASFRPNRFGLYHVSGNAAEWTQSINTPYNRDQPYSDDERNHDETPGLRTARGGSWYSAATSYLSIPYRDAFQPEHSSQELGFRVVARLLP